MPQTPPASPGMTPGAPAGRVAAISAAVTMLSYLAWLGWDQRYDVSPSGHATGPYEVWQVVGLVVALGVLTIWVGRRQQPIVGAVLVTLTLTACFSIDAATDVHGDGLWVIGATLLAVMTFALVFPVAAITASVARNNGRTLGTEPR